MNTKSPPRRPVPRLTRKSYQEQKAYTTARLKDWVNEEKALRAGMAVNQRMIGEGDMT